MGYFYRVFYGSRWRTVQWDGVRAICHHGFAYQACRVCDEEYASRLEVERKLREHVNTPTSSAEFAPYHFAYDIDRFVDSVMYGSNTITDESIAFLAERFTDE